MKFLLFFVSLIFSLIFYIFYGLSNGKDIFLNRISNSVDLISFSGNLLIESVFFLLIGFVFIFSFSEYKSKNSNNLEINKTKLYYIIYYIIFIFSVYILNKDLDYFLLSIIIIFVIGDMLFNHISNIPGLISQKVNIRYAGLITNYLSIFLSIYYIYILELNIIPFFILIFSVIFNIHLHNKYTNYISLLLAVISLMFIIYNIGIFGLGLYIKFF